MAEIVFRKAKIVFSDSVREGDLVVDSGKIAEIVPEFTGSADREIDAKGKYLLPGVIDAHVHMRAPGDVYKEDFMTGSMAAASGGVTTFLDMPNNNPPIIDRKALHAKRVLAEQDSLVNFGFFFGATEDNMEEVLRAKNIAGVKVFVGSSTGGLFVKSEEVMDRLFDCCKVPLVFHAEDESCIARFRSACSNFSKAACHSEIRPPSCAKEAIRKILHLWKKYEKTAQVHIAHVTGHEEIAVLKKFRSDRISAEATPHHLFLSTDDYEKLGFLAKVNPPLRSAVEHSYLWNGLRDGFLQIIASDHAPHLKNEKEGEYDSISAGVPGVETLLPLMLYAVYEGRLDFVQLAKFTAENPARIFRIANKGKIQTGFDADLVLVDMELEKEVSAAALQTKCGWSPFEGRKLRGWPVMTIVNGTIVWENGKFVSGKRGREVTYLER